ncbi:MAG: hypothetical protein ABFS05_08490 [Bacteroidota bacterium]
MKGWLLSISLLLISLLAFSQEQSFYKDKKMDTRLLLGTSFSSDLNSGHAFSTMMAPEISYKLNERLSVRGGLSIANTEYGNTLVYSPYGYKRFSGNITQGMLYVSGDYMISPKVFLSGTAYKEFSTDHDGPENAFRPGYDGQGLMMNLRLIPSENMIIDIGAEIYEGNNPYRSGFYKPYKPFGRRW